MFLLCSSSSDNSPPLLVDWWIFFVWNCLVRLLEGGEGREGEGPAGEHSKTLSSRVS